MKICNNGQVFAEAFRITIATAGINLSLVYCLFEDDAAISHGTAYILTLYMHPNTNKTNDFHETSRSFPSKTFGLLF